MRALSIRQPHAEAIMRGVKPVEYRSRPTKIREVICVYTAKGRYSRAVESEWMIEYGIKNVSCDDLPRRVFIGTVELYDCTGKPGSFKWHVRKPKRASRLRRPRNHPQPSWFTV